MAQRVSFRPAVLNDVDRLVDIHASAFPDPRHREVRARHFVHNPFGGLDDLWIAAAGDRVLGHAFLYPLEAWFGGQPVRVAGIASVGVAPESRGQGVARALVEHLHEVALGRGEGIAVLYPFRQGFYARLGYGAVTPYRRLQLAPSSIPWTRAELGARPPSGSDDGALRACWQAAGLRRTGSLVRSERLWEARLLDPRRVWLVVESATGVEGYVAWTLAQREPHAEITLVVREAAAMTAAGERSVWGLLSAQRDQVARIEIDVAAGDPFEVAVLDADRGRAGEADVEHPLGQLVSGPMLRMLDPARALATRGWQADGALVLDTGQVRWAIVVRDGRATVTESEAQPDLRADPVALASMAFGSVRPSHAARLGWLTAREDRAIALADALFALPPYFSPDAF